MPFNKFVKISVHSFTLREEFQVDHTFAVIKQNQHRLLLRSTFDSFPGACGTFWPPFRRLLLCFRVKQGDPCLITCDDPFQKIFLVSHLPQIQLTNVLMHLHLLGGQLVWNKLGTQFTEPQILLQNSLHRRWMETSFLRDFLNCQASVTFHKGSHFIHMLRMDFRSPCARQVTHWICLCSTFEPFCPHPNLRLRNCLVSKNRAQISPDFDRLHALCHHETDVCPLVNPLLVWRHGSHSTTLNKQQKKEQIHERKASNHSIKCAWCAVRRTNWPSQFDLDLWHVLRSAGSLIDS